MFRFLVRSKSFACIYISTLLFIIFFKKIIKKLIVLFTKNISDWQQPTLLLHCFSRNFRAISERVTVTIISSPSYDGHMFHKIWDKDWFGLRQIWETLSDDFNILLVKFRGNDQGPKTDPKSWKVLTQSLVGLLQNSFSWMLQDCKMHRWCKHWGCCSTRPMGCSHFETNLKLCKLRSFPEMWCSCPRMLYYRRNVKQSLRDSNNYCWNSWKFWLQSRGLIRAFGLSLSFKIDKPWDFEIVQEWLWWVPNWLHN